MLKSVLSFGFVILLNLTVQAQLDSYKYVIVPKKFDGFKYENRFRTSTLLKFLFLKMGIQPYMKIRSLLTWQGIPVKPSG